MAKNIIYEVKNAEVFAEQREEESRNAAAEIISSAEEKAKLIYMQKLSEAKSTAAEMISEAKSQYTSAVTEISDEFSKEFDISSSNISSKENEVINLIINEICK